MKTKALILILVIVSVCLMSGCGWVDQAVSGISTAVGISDTATVIAKTAQVRTSGTVLALIPVFLTLALWFVSPEYIGSFFDRGPLCGWAAVITIVAMISAGYFVMMKIANIEV